MNSPLPSAAERQAALQQRMLVQRALIARLLQPVEALAPHPPRSLTMLFFNRHPGLATQLLTQGATLLVGGRLLQAVSMALLLGRAVRGLANQRR